MKKLLTSVLIMAGMHAMAQTKEYSVSKDEKNGELVFNGHVTFSELNGEPSFGWLKSGHDEYKPDMKTTGFLKDRLKDYTLVVFLGTWCEDSHELVPKLEKVLDLCSYPMDKVTIYAADREKHTQNGENKKYGITLVPTIILFRDGKEAGRITESVQKSIEHDMALIIEKDSKK